MNIFGKIGVGLLGLISIVIFVVAFKIAKPAEPNVRENNAILFLRTSDGTIQLFNYTSKDEFLEVKRFLDHQNDKITAFAPFHNNTIFYGTKKENKPIHSALADHNNVTFRAREWTKTAMAIDDNTDTLYVLDGQSRKLYLADLHGSYYSVIEDNLEEPKDVALDVQNGIVFILQSSSISGRKLGESKKVMVEQSNLQAFTVDPSRKMLYYSDGNKVVSLDWIRNEVTVFNFSNVISLAYGNNHLFFIENTTDSSDKTLKACNLDKTTWINRTCNVEKLYSSSNLEQVKLYEENPFKLSSGCGFTVNNLTKPCDQMCSLGRCACTNGWKLKNNYTCIPEDELYINIDSTAIVKYQHDHKNLSEVLINSTWGIRSFQPLRNSSFIYSTENLKEKILSNNVNYKLPDQITVWTVAGLATAENDTIYVADEVHARVGVASINTEYAKTLLSNLDRPRDVVVDPELGLMFILQASSILKANMDGSDVKVLYKHEGLAAFALDQRNRKLYLAVSNVIVCIDYEANLRKKVTDLGNSKAISLAVVSGDLFAVIEKDYVEKSIQKCRLSNGAQTCKFTLVYENDLIVDIKSRTEGKLKTACSENNGGCNQFCLLRNDSKQFSCACSFGWDLNDDKKTCNARIS